MLKKWTNTHFRILNVSKVGVYLKCHKATNLYITWFCRYKPFTAVQTSSWLQCFASSSTVTSRRWPLTPVKSRPLLPNLIQSSSECPGVRATLLRGLPVALELPVGTANIPAVTSDPAVTFDDPVPDALTSLLPGGDLVQANNRLTENPEPSLSFYCLKTCITRSQAVARSTDRTASQQTI